MKRYLIILFILILIVRYSFFLNHNTPLQMPIPKVIHYVWLGSKELPPNVQKAINTWKKHMPDYKIKRWDERNCDVNANFFVKKNYHFKKYDFASDWCRLIALQEGGIYLDTDMFLNQSLTPVLNAPLVLTLQEKDTLSASFMATIGNHPFILALKREYERRLNTSIEAPKIWTDTFRNLFHKIPHITTKKNAPYQILAPQILMYDFKGKENRAYHQFGNGSIDAHQTHWFKEFHQRFLTDFCFYFPEREDYLVILDEDRAYFVDKTTHQQTEHVKYKKFFMFLKIKTNKQTTFYFCKTNSCTTFFSRH